ncbi:unnamed protein product [Rhizophagus irregularis]|nr:unnamed protein product [Rhizophagus irregularis]
MLVVNFIAKLSDSKIQTIIDYFPKNPNTDLLGDQDNSIIDSKEEILDDQTNALEMISTEVNISTAPIFLIHVSNSSDDSSEFSPVNSSKAEDDFNKMIIETFEEKKTRIEKERQNKVSSNVVTSAKLDKETNEIETENYNDCSHDSDSKEDLDDGYNGYNGYNEYNGCNRA